MSRFFTSDLALVEHLTIHGFRWKCWRAVPSECFGFAKTAELQKCVEAYIAKSAAALRHDAGRSRAFGRESEAVVRTPEQLLAALTT